MIDGSELYRWARDLFPLCRSLSGQGVRNTLLYFQRLVPELTLREIASGTQVLDWVVPQEWNVREAYLLDPEGAEVVNFSRNNLHLVGYSPPVNAELSLDDLQGHLYSLPDQPEAIPYVTSYYQPRWGFCLPHSLRLKMKPGKYKVVIDSELTNGAMTIAEAVLPGRNTDEILLSSYICHPSMANNELSGPIIGVALFRWLATLPSPRFTYRLVLAPETIGALAVLAEKKDHLRARVIAGWQLTCLGDPGNFSFMSSRTGSTLTDSISRHVLKQLAPDYSEYDFNRCGSDNRQYCYPGVDLPIASIMRSMYGTYPEYHTSLDNLDLITSDALVQSFEVYRKCLQMLESGRFPLAATIGEPQLGRRGLYPTASFRGSADSVQTRLRFLWHSDGTRDLHLLAERLEITLAETQELFDLLLGQGLITERWDR